MSFVKKAAKKVFKAVKKVVKKVWKPVLIGSAILFTAGVATVGFGAFSAAGGLSGFLGSVGTTMAAGGQALLGTVGLGSGLSTGIAGATGAVPGTTLLNGALAQGLGLAAAPANMGLNAAGVPNALAAGSGVSTSSLAGLGGGAATGATTTALGTTAGTGFMAKAGSALSGMFSGPVGKMALFNGISSGIQGYMASEAASKERKRDRRRNFFGGPMRGGGTDNGIDFPTFGQAPEVPTPSAPAGLDPAFARGQLPQQPQQSSLLQPGNLDLLAEGNEQPVQFMSRPPAFGGFV